MARDVYGTALVDQLTDEELAAMLAESPAVADVWATIEAQVIVLQAPVEEE
jgi:hypothetical protein